MKTSEIINVFYNERPVGTLALGGLARHMIIAIPTMESILQR